MVSTSSIDTIFPTSLNYNSMAKVKQKTKKPKPAEDKKPKGTPKGTPKDRTKKFKPNKDNYDDPNTISGYGW